jgi:hypothetical protein
MSSCTACRARAEPTGCAAPATSEFDDAAEDGGGRRGRASSALARASALAWLLALSEAIIASCAAKRER